MANRVRPIVVSEAARRELDEQAVGAELVLARARLTDRGDSLSHIGRAVDVTSANGDDDTTRDNTDQVHERLTSLHGVLLRQRTGKPNRAVQWIGKKKGLLLVTTCDRRPPHRVRLAASLDPAPAASKRVGCRLGSTCG